MEKVEKVFIVTDSTADIPKDLVESLGITVVPLKVHIKEQTYLDGVTITASEFYKMLEEVDDLPTTSQPSPIDFVEVYKEIHKKNEGAKIISIHLSSALSGTVQSALLAQTMVEEEGITVSVVDTKTASYAIGMIAVAAAEAVKNGKSYDEIVTLANQLVVQTKVFFLVDTLTYLQKGGRIGKAASLFGSLLNIKPILSLNENGEVYPVDKVRGKGKALSRIIELLSETANGKKVRLGISHAVNLEDTKKVEEKFKEIFDYESLVITEIGPVIGTHTGPGTIALFLSIIE